MESKNDDVDSPYFSSMDFDSSECDRCVLTDQRIFYLHRQTRRSLWLPPKVAWNCTLGLKYGLERGVDEFGTHYFINHLNQTTSYAYPAADHAIKSGSEQIVVPPTRSYEIWRSPKFNYGFIASSERPVVIQFVTPGGPSDGRLMPKDQILTVNGVDVRQENKLGVVQMIRKSATVLKLEVTQPPRKLENGISGLISRRVRFTEHIVIVGAEEPTSLLSMPNVLKVYTDVGQIKSLKYTSETTIQDILSILMEKIQIRQPDHFALAIEQSISLEPSRISYLPNTVRVETLVNSSLLSQARCRLRIAFPPQELLSYLKNDPVGFDYLYQQCVNDFVDGRYIKIRYEASLRLAALHIRQVCLETTSSKYFNSTSIYHIEREYGLATFLPTIWLEKIKPHDLREHLQFFLNKDEETFNELKKYLIKQKTLSANLKPSSKNVTDTLADIAQIIRIKYVTLMSLLPDFGVTCFNVSYKPTEVNMIITVDPRCGVVVRYPDKESPPAITINFTSIDEIYDYKENDLTCCVCLKLVQDNFNTVQRSLEFYVDQKDSDNLIAHIIGYAKLATNRIFKFYKEKPSNLINAPPYLGLHFVSPASWNYCPKVDPNTERVVNFAEGPPSFEQVITSTSEFSTSNSMDKMVQAETAGQLRKNSSVETEFIDVSPIFKMCLPHKESIEKLQPSLVAQQRRRSSQQRFTQMLVGTAHAILQRNRVVTAKRFRDSLKVHRQRHSVPNAHFIPDMSFMAERRWSSATQKDIVASAYSINENTCISRSALVLRPSYNNIITNSQTTSAGSSTWVNSARADSHLGLPLSVTQLQANLASIKQLSQTKESIIQNRINTSLTRSNLRRNRLVHRFRRSWSLDEKHVRFDFTSNIILLPPSPEPPVTPEDLLLDKHVANANDEFFFQPYITFCTRKFGQLSTSCTFPMGSNQQEFGEDFVPRSYQVPAELTNATKPTVRRMSLKEFTGLENVTEPVSVPRHNSAAFPNGIDSSALTRLQTNALDEKALSISRSNEYLNNCGRRRSSFGLYGSGFGSREHVYEPFNKVIDEISAVIDSLDLNELDNMDGKSNNDSIQGSDLDQIVTKIETVRKRLSITLEKMPPQSPKKHVCVEEERRKILFDIAKLSQASKRLIRSVYAPSAKEREENTICAVQLADSVTKQCEKLLEKRSSFYQAHLLKAELDQLLRALTDTVKDAGSAVDRQRYGPEFKKLSKSSNSLAAAFTQLIRAIKAF